MRNFIDNVVGKIKTRILGQINLFFENRAFYEIMLKNLVEPERPQMKTQYGAHMFRAG